ncbi:MAG TPA: hypothetical protein VGM88_30815 [Kofleriaceae bacterium]
MKLAALVVLASSVAAAAPAGEVIRVEHHAPDEPPSRGPANALVTVEVFFVTLSHIERRVPGLAELERLADAHPHRVRIVYRPIRGPVNGPGSALLEAYAEGVFRPMLDELNRATSSIENEGDAGLVGLAIRSGAKPSAVLAAAHDGRYLPILDANEHRFAQLTANTAFAGGATAGVFFNGQLAIGLGSDSRTAVARAYADAYDRALDKLAHGVRREDLAAAFDADARAVEPVVVRRGPTGIRYTSDADQPVIEPRLANPSLVLDGMPSYGADPNAALVVILCRPSDTENCSVTMSRLESAVTDLGDEFRVVWAPWFDVLADNAPDLATLADAALCAEQVGAGTLDDRRESAGWIWLKGTFDVIRSHRRRVAGVESMIDEIAHRVGVNSRELAACRARMAGASLRWITEARRAGVTGDRAVVVGGRIYPNLENEALIRRLVDEQLAPGVLGTIAPSADPPAHSDPR